MCYRIFVLMFIFMIKIYPLMVCKKKTGVSWEARTLINSLLKKYTLTKENRVS